MAKMTVQACKMGPIYYETIFPPSQAQSPDLKATIQLASHRHLLPQGFYGQFPD